MKETLVIFQCCKKKSAIELYPNDNFDLAIRIPRTKKILDDAVVKFSRDGVIDISSPPVTSLSRYDGHFYNAPRLRSRVAYEARHGPYQFLIMSAGYGFVHPFQRIRMYGQRMTGRITRYWLNVGLPRVLEEFIETCKFRKVYGFFSKSADYRKIFEAVNWHQLDRLKEAGYFYLEGMRGAGKILKTSAMLMLKLLDENFEERPVLFRGSKPIFVRTL